MYIILIILAYLIYTICFISDYLIVIIYYLRIVCV